MRIAIIDADLIGRKRHRFPNLACLKLSGYYKEIADSVELKLDYKNLDTYDKVFISKAFTDTFVPKQALALSNVECGGTGFYYDKAPPLPLEIEHHMPDYDLYDPYIKQKISEGVPASEFRHYTEYSIGFTTRGCFRKCSFCVNRSCEKVTLHSPPEEFVVPTRRKICLLDDNVLGCPNGVRCWTHYRKSERCFNSSRDWIFVC